MKRTILTIVLAIVMAGTALAAQHFPKAYAAEFGASSVAVIDTEDNQVLKHISLPNGVHGLIVTPDGSRVFISSDESGVISVIDTAKDEIIAKIPAGKAPHGLIASRDGQHIFAAIFGDNQIIEINAKSLKIERTLDAPAPHNIAISNDNKTLYVAAQQQSNTGVAQIDIPSGKLITLVRTEKVPRSLNLSPDGSVLTVTQFDQNNLRVYSTKPFRLLTEIPVGGSPHHTIFTPNGKLVLVCNQVTNDVTLIDAINWKVTGSVQVGKKPHWIAPSSDSEYAYVTDEASNQVSFLDLREKKVEATINLAAGPRKIAIQSGKIPEMESEHEMAHMDSEHRMDTMGPEHKMDAMSSDQKMVSMQSDKTMAAMESNHQMGTMESGHKMAGKHVTVKMGGPPPRFEPQVLEIEAGTTVDWINEGTKVHTVTDENNTWDSGSMEPGEKFSKEFDQKGTFKYYCVPHRDIGMVGTVVVK